MCTRHPAASMIFRLGAHTRRMLDSAKIHKILLPYSAAEINQACRDVITRNGLSNGAYIRPVAFRGYGDIGLAHRRRSIPVDVAVAAWEWGAYLGADALEKGRGRVHILVAARRTEHHPGAGESRRQLPVQHAGQPGGP